MSGLSDYRMSPIQYLEKIISPKIYYYENIDLSLRALERLSVQFYIEMNSNP